MPNPFPTEEVLCLLLYAQPLPNPQPPSQLPRYLVVPQITLTERNKARAQAASSSRAPAAPRPHLVEVQATSRVA